MYNNIRFSPSPTGKLHIGNSRTALFCWLLAKKTKNNFIIRIDNTNKKHSKQKYINIILKSIKWLKIQWNKKIIYQSERLKKYEKVIQYLLKNKFAYKCFCSKKRIQKLKIEQLKKKEKPKYDNLCRNKIFKNITKKKYTIRFKIPNKETTEFTDKIYGKIKIKNKELDDFILKRSNKTYTYNLATVVDDIEMKIKNIIRGEEHINNTVKQINIFKCLKSEIPNFIHIPLITKKGGQKLSKRSKTKSLLEYKKEGFLPEAMINYLLKLGWSYKNKEIMNEKEIIKYFNIQNINKSSAQFDEKKLIWYNKYYIKNLPIIKIIKLLKIHLRKLKIKTKDNLKLEKIVNLQKTRHETINKIAKESIFFFKQIKINKIKYKNYENNKVKIILKNILTMKKINWNKEEIKINLINISNITKSKIENLFNLIRILLTNKEKSLPIIQTIDIIGKEDFLNRISKIYKNIN